MKNIETKFDYALSQIPHYIKFPELMPFVGKSYIQASKKILFLGESHYLPNKSNVNLNPKDWYSKKNILINNIESDWINTRLILLGDWKPRGHKIYREIEKTLKESKLFIGDRLLDNCSYMNAFQRPAVETGQSIKKTISDLDVSSSLQVIKNVISIIEPDMIFFLSKLSWNYFGALLKIDYPNKIIDYSVHPASYRFWNCKVYKDSRFKIINIIKNN